MKKAINMNTTKIVLLETNNSVLNSKVELLVLKGTRNYIELRTYMKR